MFTFILKRDWEFQARSHEEAKKIADEIMVVVPEGVMQTGEQLNADEDSVVEYWEKKDAAY